MLCQRARKRVRKYKLACNFLAVNLENSDMLWIYFHSIHGTSVVSHSPGANKSQSDIDLLTETDGLKQNGNF